ncbi:MAG TPA: prolyl oligopeptidase family serine peptidase [Dehalococcoidia bacterium]
MAGAGSGRSVRRRRTAWWVVLPLLAIASLLAACGGEAAPAPAPPETAPAPVDPAAPGPYAVGVARLTFQRTSTTTGAPRPLETVVWYPAGQGGRWDAALAGSEEAPVAPGGPFPVVIFSHGSGGNPLQSTFFTAHLAGHGFVVAAVPHPGNTTSDCFPCSDPAALLDSALNRPDDVSFVLDRLLEESARPGGVLQGAVDGDRAAVAGHSFGGYTALTVLARDARFRAGVAMAPPEVGGVRAAAGTVRSPVLIMGGELDTTTPIQQQRTLFDARPEGATRFLLVFPRGGHSAYANICRPAVSGCGPDDLPQEDAHRLVNRYATAFLKTYVAGEEGYGEVLAQTGEVEGGAARLEAAP